MNIIIGLALIASGIYSIFKIISGKEKKDYHFILKPDIFLFEQLFGKEKAHSMLILFVSIIEIIFGIAFLIGKLSL